MNNKARDPRRGLKAVVLNWLGFGLTDYQQWAQLAGRESDTGITVTTEKALTLSAVWACTRLVSQTIATLPLSLYRRQPGTGRQLEDRHAIARIIHSRPNADMTATVFWEGMVARALLQGNAWAEKLRVGNRVVALEPLCNERFSWRCDSSGTIRFFYAERNGAQREIDSADLFHLPGFTFGDRFGLSVIHYGVQVFGSALAGNQAANKTFKNGLMPTTYFHMERVLQEKQREQFRDNITELSGALNAGKTPLLEGGMKVGNVGINPSDAQLLESRVYSVEEVCRWFGVPPTMIGGGDKASSWASSSEQLNLWFLKYGLRPWLKRIEDAIWSSLLTPAEQVDLYAEFSVEGLLRADTVARSQLYASALQNGWMNRNQVRGLENMGAIPGGEVFTVQSNLIPIDGLGGADAQGNLVRAAFRHWLAENPE